MEIFTPESAEPAAADNGVYLLAIVLALVIAALDWRTGAPQFDSWLIIVFSLLLGYLRPLSAWRWGLIIGAGIPAGQLLRLLPWQTWSHSSHTIQAIAFWLHLGTYPPNPVGGMVAFVPAFAAAYLGSWMHQTISSWRDPLHHS